MAGKLHLKTTTPNTVNGTSEHLFTKKDEAYFSSLGSVLIILISFSDIYTLHASLKCKVQLCIIQRLEAAVSPHLKS